MPLPSHGPPAVSQRRLHSATSLPPPLSTGVHNSLKPLKLAKQRNNNGAVGNDVDGAIGVASLVLEADSEEHVLPGGVGTFSIRQASDAPLREEADSHGIVRGAFLPALHGSRMENAHETSSGSRAHRAQSIMWQDSGIDQKSTATRAEGRSSTSNASQRPSTPRSKHSTTKQ